MCPNGKPCLTCPMLAIKWGAYLRIGEECFGNLLNDTSHSGTLVARSVIFTNSPVTESDNVDCAIGP